MFQIEESGMGVRSKSREILSFFLSLSLSLSLSLKVYIDLLLTEKNKCNIEIIWVSVGESLRDKRNILLPERSWDDAEENSTNLGRKNW